MWSTKEDEEVRRANMREVCRILEPGLYNGTGALHLLRTYDVVCEYIIDDVAIMILTYLPKSKRPHPRMHTFEPEEVSRFIRRGSWGGWSLCRISPGYPYKQVIEERGFAIKRVRPWEY